MKQEGLKYFTDTHLTAIALVIFFVFFVVMVAVVYSKNRKKYYERLSKLPLKGDSNE
tara:strand:- start:6687 stop:6857 length:171 start_codon:yes stop_codon:yes gene_type:complete